MPNINLLPWRAMQLRRMQQRFIRICIFTALAALLMTVTVGQMIHGAVRDQERLNALIQADIDAISLQIRQREPVRLQQDQLLRRLQAVDDLKRGQGELILLLSRVALHAAPERYLTRLSRKGLHLTFEGVATDSRSVSELMRQLAQWDALDNPQLTHIRRRHDQGVTVFSLQMVQKPPLMYSDDRTQRLR